jgi:hypothetical protein
VEKPRLKSERVAQRAVVAAMEVRMIASQFATERKFHKKRQKNAIVPGSFF